MRSGFLDIYPTFRKESTKDCRQSANRLQALDVVSVMAISSSIESVRDLIAIPAEIEAVLCLYAKQHPEDAPGIEKVLRFRTLVREEFYRLVRESEEAATSRDRRSNSGSFEPPT